MEQNIYIWKRSISVYTHIQLDFIALLSRVKEEKNKVMCVYMHIDTSMQDHYGCAGIQWLRGLFVYQLLTSNDSYSFLMGSEKAVLVKTVNIQSVLPRRP